MQADPAIQVLLLRVAAIDTQSVQTQRRKVALPQHAELSALNAQRLAAAEQVVALRARISDAETDLTRLDADLEVAKGRLARDRQRLDDGVVTENKQLASLEAEIAHLTGRIALLEDESLAAMQAVEDDEAAVVALGEAREQIEARMRALIASRDDATREADAELADLARERAGLAERVPADVMAVYTKVAAKTGTGAAELRVGRCTGCGLQLDGLALRAATEAAPEAIVRCEECGRILVRASE